MTINEIFKSYAPEYINHFADSIPSEHLKVINAIINCRTRHYGTMIYKCEECGQNHVVYQSCGNRHCPNCQHHKAHQWLVNQISKQLPGHHFMITFTIPENLRRFIRSNQRLCYAAMFKASSESIKKLALDNKYIGGDLTGFLGVLHTWGRQLSYHPHIHYVVPGGAFSKKDGCWHPSRIDFFLPVKALSNIFKAKFRNEMVKSSLYHLIPQNVWNQDWVVNSQAVGPSSNCVQYLAPYVFKVAISNSRILKVEDHKVCFKYKKSRSNRWRTMSLDVMEFIRRFLQHVLPTGFMKVRYYGFLAPGASIPLEKISTLIELAFGFCVVKSKPIIKPFRQPTCSHCGGILKYFASFFPLHPLQPETG